jgi:hypothetical protein
MNEMEEEIGAQGGHKLVNLHTDGCEYAVLDGIVVYRPAAKQ